MRLAAIRIDTHSRSPMEYLPALQLHHAREPQSERDVPGVQLQEARARMHSGPLMLPPGTLRRLEGALRRLRHGSVQLVVHDGQIVRIERIEHTRLTVTAEASSTTVWPLASSGDAA